MTGKVRSGKKTSAAKSELSQSKRELTRSALVDTSLRLIALKGIEATSVLDITEALSVSNGSFYYHFENKEQLLEVLGHAVLEDLIERIEKLERADPAQRIVGGLLLMFQQADRFPEQRAIMLRVIEDPAGRHADLSNQLLSDIKWGIKINRFNIENADIATQFCRSLLGTAMRRRHTGDLSKRLALITAAHTLMTLGIESREAVSIAKHENTLLTES